jgi:hypothetical protein
MAMALNANLLRGTIQTVLTPFGLYSPEAEELLMATAAQESLLGKYREQVGGPALGIFQMEPATFHDIIVNYLSYHPTLDASILALGGQAQDMINNDALAIAMARVQYLRAPEKLPAATDLAGIWSLYKKRWNTPLGAAKQIDFYRHYHELVQGAAR